MNVRKQAIALAAFLVMVAAVLLFWGNTLTSASQGVESLPARPAAVDSRSDQPLDLDKAAEKAEDLSEDVYNGLETTKTIIGKTEARNQAIEYGRDSASEKLKGLAERARQAQDPERDLSVTDQKNLKRISQ